MTTNHFDPLARFKMLVDAYGANPARWPAAERTWMTQLVETEAEAARHLETARRLDGWLDSMPVPSPSVALEARILEAAQPDPARRRWLSLWPFGPLWQPALAMCLALLLGLGAGVAGFGAQPDQDEFGELAEMADSVALPGTFEEFVE